MVLWPQGGDPVPGFDFDHYIQVGRDRETGSSRIRDEQSCGNSTNEDTLLEHRLDVVGHRRDECLDGCTGRVASFPPLVQELLQSARRQLPLASAAHPKSIH